MIKVLPGQAGIWVAGWEGSRGGDGALTAGGWPGIPRWVTVPRRWAAIWSIWASFWVAAARLTCRPSASPVQPFALGFADAGDQVVADFGQPRPLGGLGAQ